MRSTKEATQKRVKADAERRMNRKLKIIGHVRLNPGTTKYRMSKELAIPHTAVHNIVRELVEEGIVEGKEMLVNGRKQRRLYMAPIDITEFTNYDVDNLTNPVILHNIRKTLRAQPIQIEMENGEITEIRSEEELNQLIERLE